MAQYTQLEEVLTDVDDPQSELPCIDCGVEEFIPLCWYQYDDQAHAHGDVKLCMHCNYPLPKNEDFVMCSNQRHTLCLYCLELKLFRIALGRFVAVMFFFFRCYFCIVFEIKECFVSVCFTTDRMIWKKNKQIWVLNGKVIIINTYEKMQVEHVLVVVQKKEQVY